MSKISELREQSTELLVNMIEDLNGEIFQMRNELAGAHKTEKPHLIREKRRTKARALTILTEREREHGE